MFKPYILVAVTCYLPGALERILNWYGPNGGLEVVPPAGIQGAGPLGGGEGAKPPEASAFSKIRLEFVRQVDGTSITKVLIKSKS